MNCQSSFLDFVGIWRIRLSFLYKIVSFCCFYVNSFLSLWKFGLRCEATRFYIDVNMKNTENNRIWLIGCVGLFVSSYSDVEAATEEHPNLLVVMADEFRGDALGFRGKEAVKTPNLDQFAQEAVVLTQAVSGYPVSSPARGMFLSGAYPHENGVLTNCQSVSAHQNLSLIHI